MGLLDKLFNREIKDTPSEPVPVPEPVQQSTVDYSGEAFHMIVEDVFTITGRGTVVTGRIDTGVINNGDTININGAISTRVLGIEMFRKSLDMAQAGDACGLLLENVTRDEVNRGDILTK